jgi:hypothetical protein
MTRTSPLLRLLDATGGISAATCRRASGELARSGRRLCSRYFTIRGCATAVVAASLACASPNAMRYADNSWSTVIIADAPETTHGGESLYDLLRRTAPAYLRSRVGQSDSTPQFDPSIGVYVDGFFAGGIEALQTIAAVNVLSIRRITAAEMGSSYTRKHASGVLEVKLKK